MAARVVNNVGIGGVIASFLNLTTTVAAMCARPVTQADLDAGRDACSIVGNNEIGIPTTTCGLFGKVIAVSDELTVKGFPIEVSVQCKGFMTLNGTTSLPTVVGDQAGITCRGGKIADAGATTAHLLGSFGKVTNVWDTDRIDVLL